MGATGPGGGGGGGGQLPFPRFTMGGAGGILGALMLTASDELFEFREPKLATRLRRAGEEGIVQFCGVCVRETKRVGGMSSVHHANCSTM